MKGKWTFLFYTIAIWGCYYVQLYVAFFAFPFTRELCAQQGLAFGLTPCLVAFVLSSIGMAIYPPTADSVWNIAVMFGLAIYGVSTADGTAFSMLQWSGQTVMLIILGIFTMAYISLDKRKMRKFHRMKPEFPALSLHIYELQTIMNFNDDKDDFLTVPTYRKCLKHRKLLFLSRRIRITGSRMSQSLNTCCLRVVTLQYGSV